tara:strand:+ start:66 stop:230 length:165 start_codon:yes stop_codon:yes gene_type:complete
MNKIAKILIERDGYTEDEALSEINEMRSRIYEGEDPEEILYEIGLEPDYIFDLI